MQKKSTAKSSGAWVAGLAGAAAVCFSASATGVENPDPLLNLMLKKGLITQDEATEVKAEAEAQKTNEMPVIPDSKWGISKAIKNIDLFGDIRLRYEDRQAVAPGGARIQLDRARYAVRLGLRGTAAEDFYYGIRVETSTNPRSPWATFGSSTGVFGKSSGSIGIGQVYVGWKPEDWVDITVGKMPMPLFTTAMVWDSDISPEGASERFKYSVGQADFFANFAQFLYADFNPSSASLGLLGAPNAGGQRTSDVFLLAWQAGVKYNFTTNLTAKVGATIYNYIGLQTNGPSGDTSPFYGQNFVGEGGYLGPGSGTPVNGSTVDNPNSQVGINDLLILEIPFEVNFKIKSFDARIFGDFAYNFDGSERAEKAQAAYANYLTMNHATIGAFSPQRDENKAYQIGAAIASEGNLGLVYGSNSRKHAWEFRTYWQHIEQYALDANLLDSDFFEGRGNLEGVYAAAAYGFSENVIATLRYGYAERINKNLGTGGSNLDIPQVNPIDHYYMLQMDLTFKF